MSTKCSFSDMMKRFIETRVNNIEPISGAKRKIEECTSSSIKLVAPKAADNPQAISNSLDDMFGVIIFDFADIRLTATQEELFLAITKYLQLDHKSKKWNCYFGTCGSEAVDMAQSKIRLHLLCREGMLYCCRKYLESRRFALPGISIVLGHIILCKENIEFVSSGSMQPWEVVVARHSESISWIPELWFRSCSVYNKGTSLGPEFQDRFRALRQLPNVGRESHTYLSHIVANYDNLATVTYFTQAYPFDHSPKFIEAVNAGVGRVAAYTMLGCEVHTIVDHNVAQYDGAFPGMQDGFNRTFSSLFGQHHEQFISFTPGAIFSVHRSSIWSRPKQFYVEAMELLSYDVNPIEGLSFERLWGLIFNL